MQILYKGDNGELLLISWQRFATAASPPSRPPPPRITSAMFLLLRDMKLLPPMELLPQLSIESHFGL